MLRFILLSVLCLMSWKSFATCHEEHSTPLSLENPIEESSVHSYIPELSASNLGLAISLAFAGVYYKTGNAYHALISVGSLGFFAVCSCNGRIKFGLCPQKIAFVTTSVAATLATLFAAKKMHDPQNLDL